MPRRVTHGLAGACVLALTALDLGCAGPGATSPSSLAAPSAAPAATSVASAAGAIVVGGVFPISGNAAGLARQEMAGVQIAFDLVNEGGGVDGRPLALEVKDLETATDAPGLIAALQADGASVIVGGYSSDLSIAAASAAADAGMVYWEAGAVADRLTGHGLPLVFRVGPSGSTLGTNSATFAATELAPRLGKSDEQMRVAIVAARDDYAWSVAAAARRTARSLGVPVVADQTYDLYNPDWATVMSALHDSAPDVILLASHIPDGVAFRQQMIAAGVHAGALIGTTMAECDPDFAGDLGPDAVGVFASDRPTGGFQSSVLSGDAHDAYDELAQRWSESGMPAAPSDATSDSSDEYAIAGPSFAQNGSDPTEEGLSGFSAAWALGHYVLPAAAHDGGLDSGGVAAAARVLDLPPGALPNGAGVRFSSEPGTLGQNERAVGVIWQWQAVNTYTFVWPPAYATGQIEYVPLAK